MADDLKYIIESLLFIAESPLTVDQLRGVLEAEDPHAIKAAVDELIAEYDTRDGGFVLRQVAGGYQFRTQARHNPWIKRMVKPSAPRLSRAALETLAIIAYNQPIIRNDIEHIRGVDSGGVLRMLMERKLIRVLGRKEIPGRPLIYATTKHFLEVFELKDLRDLPTPKEIEELGRSRLESGGQATDPPGDLSDAINETGEDKTDKAPQNDEPEPPTGVSDGLCEDLPEDDGQAPPRDG